MIDLEYRFCFHEKILLYFNSTKESEKMALTWYNDEVNISDDVIVEIETRLDVQFPESYREMLKAHGGDGCEELEEMISPEELESMSNLGEYFCLNYMNEDELSQVIPIFASVDGNYYAFDYTVLNEDNEPTIIDVDHEEDELSADEITRYDSFEEFVASFN